MFDKRRTLAMGCLTLGALISGCTDDRAATEVRGDRVEPIQSARITPRFQRSVRTDTITGERFIIRFRDDVTDHVVLASALAKAHGSRLIRTYSAAFKGFNIVVPPGVASSGVVDAIQRDPHVLYVQKDQRIKLSDVQHPVNWGLDRIDQGYAFGGGPPYYYDGAFSYFQTGAGVNVYIIDSGIAGSHSEFAGRIGNLSYTSVWPSDPYSDCLGHGTNVASVALGATVGVAKGAIVNSLQTASCTDGTSDDGDIIDAIDHIISNGQHPGVINISSSHNGQDIGLEDAVRNALNAGFTVVVAAGNDNANACNYTPARVGEALTVGAMTLNNDRSTFSNYGSCLDLFAPGTSVDVATNTGGFGTNSGTSFATPYVTGVAALLLQESPGLGAGSVNTILTGSATSGAIANVGTGSPNKLLFSLHTYLTVSGLNSVCGNTTYTWTSGTWGGDGSKVYDWVITYNNGNDEIYPGPTNSTSFTSYIDRTIGDFDVTVSLMTNGQSYFRTMHVFNGIC